MQLALQRFQQAGPVLDLYFALQLYEPRDFPQGRTLRGRRCVAGRLRFRLFGQVSPTLPWRAAAMPPRIARQRHHRRIDGFEPTTRWAIFGHAFDKTEISITVLGLKCPVPSR
jgi:hypothetical protein